MTFYRHRLMLAVLAVGIAMPLAATAAEVKKKEAVIVVSAEADAATAPDLAIVSLGVTRTEKTARAALDGNSKAMAEVLKSLKGEGIAERDLQTSNFSIQAQYSYPENSDGTQKPPVLVGYQVSNMLTVRVRDLSRLGAILDQSVSLGVNQGGDIRFSNDNPDKVIEEARKSAVKAAFAKARTLADAAGVKLGRIVEITDTGGRPEPQPAMRMEMAKVADAVPVAAGENSYSVSVTVTFAIDQ